MRELCHSDWALRCHRVAQSCKCAGIDQVDPRPRNAGIDRQRGMFVSRVERKQPTSRERRGHRIRAFDQELTALSAVFALQ